MAPLHANNPHYAAVKSTDGGFYVAAETLCIVLGLLTVESLAAAAAVPDFVRSDFGPWGSYKKMFSPKLFVNGSDGRWTAVWSATPDGSVTAITSTADFAKWEPQRYFASRADLPRDMYASVALRLIFADAKSHAYD